MKKLLNKFLLLIVWLVTFDLFANPISVNDVCFNELAFDSTGWKLELFVNFWEEVPISLKDWYLVSGNDTAYFQDWMHISKDYFFVSEDSLIGRLDLNPKEDTIFIYDNDDYMEDYLVYGPYTHNNFPTLKYNQSLCNFHNSHYYYLDNSQTIGYANDTIDATGIIYGYVFDADEKPAVNQIVYLNGYYPIHPGIEYRKTETDSTGYFCFINAYATNNCLFVLYENSLKDLAEIFVSILPGISKYTEIHLGWLTEIEERNLSLKEYSLEQNYPNPFNPSTVISYTICAGRFSGNGFVELKVYDVLGREVTTLVNKEQSPGNYKVEFNANGLPSGIYFYKLQVSNSSGIEGFTETKKMIVLR